MEPFPYQHLPDPCSFFHRARAEGRIQEMGITDKLLYVWKYLRRPRKDAPADVMAHFGGQRRQLEAAAGFPLPGEDAALGFLGDLMWIRKNWKRFLPEETLRKLQEYGALVGNLESVICSDPVKEFLPDYFTFNSHRDLVEAFGGRGANLFAALSLANNHILDRGESGALETMHFLDNLSIPHSGLLRPGEEKRWTSFERGGISFGFLASCFGLNDNFLLADANLELNRIPGLVPEREESRPDLSLLFQALGEMAEEKMDVKIVYLHWGFEFEYYPTARMMQVARDLVKAGADLIVGSHPHVLQPSEVLYVNGYPGPADAALLNDGRKRPRKALVLYSLGNFATAMYGFRCRIAQVQGVSFFRREDGTVDWGNLRSSFFHNTSMAGGTRIEPLKHFLMSPEGKGYAAEATEILEHIGQREEAARLIPPPSSVSLVP